MVVKKKPAKRKIKRKPAAKKRATRVIYRTKRLYRSGRNRILGGVCGGIGEYFGVDPVMIRLLWVLFSLVCGSGILAYIIAWIIIPRNPNHNWKEGGIAS